MLDVRALTRAEPLRWLPATAGARAQGCGYQGFSCETSGLRIRTEMQSPALACQNFWK